MHELYTKPYMRQFYIYFVHVNDVICNTRDDDNCKAGANTHDVLNNATHTRRGQRQTQTKHTQSPAQSEAGVRNEDKTMNARTSARPPPQGGERNKERDR